MSFAPQMHGLPGQSSFFQDSTLVDLSDETAKRIATLQVKLNKKLGPEYVSQRPGPSGGPKLTYAEGWKIINLANEVFGFNGWSSNIVSLTTDFIDLNEQSQRYSVGVTAVVRVTLRDGVFHEDVGYGLLENSKSKGAALDKASCKKEAVTDAIKRSLRNFGNLLGNCLYDKSYTQEVVKMKVPPPKFNKDDLHRRPEFEDSKGTAGPSSTTYTTAPSKPATSFNRSASPVTVKSETTSRMEAILNACNTAAQQGQGVAPAVPSHIRSGSGQAGPVATSTPNVNARSSASPNAGGPNASSSAAAPRTGPTVLSNPPQRPPNEPVRGNSPAQPQDRQSNKSYPAPQPQGERRVSFAPQPVASTSGSVMPSAVTAPPQAVVSNDVDIPDDTSEFHFNSDDDAFLAEVDLGEDGIGGPLDFDEGVGSVEADDDTRNEAHDPRQPGRPPLQERPLPPQPQGHPQRSADPRAANPAQPPHAMSRSGPTNSRHETANQNNSTAHQTSKDASSTFIAQSPPTMGGFHFSTTTSTSNSHNQQRPGHAARPNYTSSTGGSEIGMKRSADVMQGNASAGAASRRPMQGMGLAPPPGTGGRPGPQGAGAQGHRRQPFSALDIGEGGDFKRMKR
ncbi:hypothetical protein EVJ58_g3459 [Rhodofomes roseus]|uniref:Uncharacterized protein n=1 Tax=Rhodofomes roseus TaxID=34475 RepID=A0A4Y9YKI2_9APHY|nr:hypothetical protein EVJ58_g3459 [Rhodofomes roseus]